MLTTANAPTYNLTACDYCGAAAGNPCVTASGRTTDKPHAAREKAADAIRAEQPDTPQDPTAMGYVCRECHTPAPTGMGYKVQGQAAAAASAATTACDCGHAARTTPAAEINPADYAEPVARSPRLPEARTDAHDRLGVSPEATMAATAPEDVPTAPAAQPAATDKQVAFIEKLLEKREPEAAVRTAIRELLDTGTMTRELASITIDDLLDAPKPGEEPLQVDDAEVQALADELVADLPEPLAYEQPHPDKVGTDLVAEPCVYCAGTGRYDRPTPHAWGHPVTGKVHTWCFYCDGMGGKQVKVSSLRSRERRAVKKYNDQIEARRAGAMEEARRVLLARAENERAEREQEAATAKAEKEAATMERDMPVGHRLRALPVQVLRVGEYTRQRYNAWEGYETARVVTFKDERGGVYVWHTTAASAWELQAGDAGHLAGTVKRHAPYNGEMQTTLNRVNFKPEA